MLIVASVFKGITINKKMRLDHESLSNPETDILKYHEYKSAVDKGTPYIFSSAQQLLNDFFTEVNRILREVAQ